jgi:predicted  nucleic acid-binding Zn-ribbon protein
MGPDIENSISLQSLDRKLIALKKEIAALPKHIAVIEQQLDSHKRRLEKDQAALAANQAERRQMESDVKKHEEKISKLKGQMLDAKTNDQYTAFQHEITFCEEAISKCETRVLELMEASEPLAAAVKEAEAALAVEQKQVAAEKKVAQERTAVDEGALKKGLQERKQLASQISPRIFSIYERLRKRQGYPVIAEGTTGRCSACNIAIRPQYLQELRQATEPFVCESCGRLLYYHATIDVQAEKDPSFDGGTRVDMTPNSAK